MLQSNATVKNRKGIHARPSATIAETAARFQSEISISHEEYRADAKKLLELLSLGADKGDRLRLEVQGPDEKQALRAVKTLIESHFPYD